MNGLGQYRTVSYGNSRAITTHSLPDICARSQSFPPGYIDSIRHTPTVVVEFPERCDDTSKASLPAVDKFVSKDPSAEVVARTVMEVICVFIRQKKNVPRTTDHFSGKF